MYHKLTPSWHAYTGSHSTADISKAVTTILLLAGSVIVAAAMGIIAEAVINPQAGWYTNWLAEKELEGFAIQVCAYWLPHAHVRALLLCC
jgi:hypothetical protein